MAPLVPLPHKRALCLVEKESGSFELPDFPGLILKESYWRWPPRELARSASPSAVWVVRKGLMN